MNFFKLSVAFVVLAAGVSRSFAQFNGTGNYTITSNLGFLRVDPDLGQFFGPEVSTGNQTTDGQWTVVASGTTKFFKLLNVGDKSYTSSSSEENAHITMNSEGTSVIIEPTGDGLYHIKVPDTPLLWTVVASSGMPDGFPKVSNSGGSRIGFPGGIGGFGGGSAGGFGGFPTNHIELHFLNGTDANQLFNFTEVTASASDSA